VSRVSPRRRTQAARLLRNGATHAQVKRETGIARSTISYWLKNDPDFLLMVRGQGVLNVGPVRLQVDHDAPLLDETPDDSAVWIDRAGTDGKPEVLGSVVVADATFLRAVFVTNAQHARQELAAGRIPIDPDAKVFMLRATALPDLADDANVALLALLTDDDPATSFRAFLSVWKFKSGEQKTTRLLDEELWDGQRELADIIAAEPYTLLLKARKLGQSTLAVAKAGWVARVRDDNARVHLYSYRERAAKRLLEQVRFGLDRLPTWLQLPLARETQIEVVYSAGPDDERTIASYPMSTHTSIEETSTHSLLDEAAFWPNGEDTMERLEPTYVSGTADIVTTGNGPVNHITALWHAAKDGTAIFRPVFLPATARPGRTPEFMERKRKSMRASSFRAEYACSESDALAGPAEREFAQEDVAACCRYPRYGPNARAHPLVGKPWPLGKAQHSLPRRNKEPLRECRYILALDVGKKDASVLTVLDVTSDTFHVAGWWRWVALDYPSLQSHVTRVCGEYPRSPIVIEQNGVGAVLTDNLHVGNPIIRFHTSATSKARLIEAIARKLQNWELQFDRQAMPNLYDELVSYAQPDDHLVQDAVMSLGFAIDQAPEAFSSRNVQGRVMGVIYT
jgi:hypothetical protein